jgi:hypothetical protein
MRSALRATAAAFLITTAVLPAAGGPIGWWRFEGKVGESADGKKVLSTINPNVMTGEGHKSKSDNARLEYSDDVPGKFVWDPVTRRYRANATSMRFASFQEKTEVGNLFSYCDYVDVPDSPLTRPAGFTIEGFIKPHESGNRKWCDIVGKARNWNMVWGVDTEDYHPGGLLKMRFKVQVKGREILQHRDADSPNLKDPNWHHFALTYSPATGEVKLYWDYQLADEFTIEDPKQRQLAYEPPRPGETYPLLIGGRKDKGWNGWLDEIRLSDQPLAPEKFLRATAEQTPGGPKEEPAADDTPKATDKEAAPDATTQPAAALDAGVEGQVAAWWRFESREGNFADTQPVRSEYNADATTGVGVRSDGGQGELFYSGDVAGEWIHDPITCKAYANSASLKFASYTADGKAYSDYVEVPDSDDLRPESLTVEGFLKREDVPANRAQILNRTRSWGPVWGFDMEELHPGARKKMRVRLQVKGRKIIQFRNAESPDLKEEGWHHFAVTYDHKTGEIKVYWDHELAVTYTIEEQDKRELFYEKGEGHKLFIGGLPGKPGWDGWIDEVRVTPAALPPEKFLKASDKRYAE